MEENQTQNNQTEPLQSTQNQRRSHGFNSRRTFSQFADNSGHILEVLKAAMPYIDSRRQSSMEALLKATDLIHTTHNMAPGGGELSAASLNPKSADIEGMLCSVRGVSSPMERDFIDRMLNFFKARKFYQTYRVFQQNKDVLKSASLNGSQGQYGTNSNFMEALKNILPPDQAANLDQVQNILNIMNAMNSTGTNQYSNQYSSSQTNSSQGNNSYQSAYENYNNQRTAPVYSKQADYSVPTMPIPSASTWQAPPSGVPNYTYQMNQPVSQPALDRNYLNQFAPAIANANNPPAPSMPQSPNMDAASITQMYNNISNIISALQAAGISPNSNSTNAATGMSTNPNSMLNMITALANSGLLNNHNTSTPSQQTMTQVQTAVPMQPFNTTPNVMQQNTMHSIPIPSADRFNHAAPEESDSSQPSQTSESSTSFIPKDLYQRPINYKNQYGLKSYQPLRDSSEQLEAASLDKE